MVTLRLLNHSGFSPSSGRFSGRNSEMLKTERLLLMYPSMVISVPGWYVYRYTSRGIMSDVNETMKAWNVRCVSYFSVVCDTRTFVISDFTFTVKSRFVHDQSNECLVNKDGHYWPLQDTCNVNNKPVTTSPIQIHTNQSESSIFNTTHLIMSQYMTHIGDHWENRNHVEDLLPCTDAVSFGSHGPAELSGEFPSVHSHLHHVINESKQRSQRKRCHKQGDEAKLDNCKRETDHCSISTFSALALLYCSHKWHKSLIELKCGYKLHHCTICLSNCVTATYFLHVL